MKKKAGKRNLSLKSVRWYRKKKKALDSCMKDLELYVEN